MKHKMTVLLALFLTAAMLFAGCSFGSTDTADAGGDIVIRLDSKEKNETAQADPEEKPESPHETQLPHETILPHETAEDTAAVSDDPENKEQTAEPAAVTVVTLERPSLLKDMKPAEADVTASVPSYSVKADLSDVYNLDQFYFNDSIKSILAENMFCIVENRNYEFFEEYEKNRYRFIPNFVTTDAMMHTYHLYFSYLLKNTEKDYLLDSLKTLTGSMLEASLSQYSDLKGSEWENAALRNSAFFTVAASLLGLPAEVPSEVTDIAEDELAAIYDHSGIMESPLASLGLQEPVFEDYSQYTIRGYYEGDADLEGYFRTMMWYGRINFAQKEEDLDRSALLMTLAMKGEAYRIWEAIYTVTAFFAGASDDSGYYEYLPAVEMIYGEDVTTKDLVGQDDKWTVFHLTTGSMDPPQINSVAVFHDGDTDVLQENKGFRFMGQRFSIDAAVFEQLIYDSVGENSDGEVRRLPDALDIPAAMGSEEAAMILDDRGATDYALYPENLEAVKNAIGNAPEGFWNASLYSKWLDTLNPLLSSERDGWPAFMQSSAWLRKNLQTYLGSYAELKHDTVLYAKQVMAEMGGGDIQDWDDRGYVEPEPALFGKLADLTRQTAEGLSGYGILSDTDRENLKRLETLASSLQTIAAKELTGDAVTEEEYELIRGFGGSLEHFWQEVNKDKAEKLTAKEFPAAVVTDIATDPMGSVLEIGTGCAGTIYVCVPVEGKLKICAGSVFSFYEFEWPINDRLTDSKWRQMMGIELTDEGTYEREPAFDTQDWTKDFQYNNR